MTVNSNVNNDFLNRDNGKSIAYFEKRQNSHYSNIYDMGWTVSENFGIFQNMLYFCHLSYLKCPGWPRNILNRPSIVFSFRFSNCPFGNNIDSSNGSEIISVRHWNIYLWHISKMVHRKHILLCIAGMRILSYYEIYTFANPI